MVLIKSKPESFFNETFFPQTFNNMMHSFFDESAVKNKPYHFIPSADILENEVGFEIRMSLPGMKKEEIKISLDGDHLTVEGERKMEEKTENSKFLKKEITYGKFSRSFTIGKTDIAKVEAAFEDGILKISLPKMAEEKAAQITIK